MINWLTIKRRVNNNIIFLKKKNGLLTIIENDNIYILLPLNDFEADTYLDKSIFSITVKKPTWEINTANEIKLLQKNEHEFKKLYFIKIKFTGKGFRLSSIKTKKVLETFFGYSHILYCYLGAINYKRLKKTKYFFWSKNNNFINTMSRITNQVKKVNPYTLRGLRLAKLQITKRKGRKSPSL